jgi:hypothetical protein
MKFPRKRTLLMVLLLLARCTQRTVNAPTNPSESTETSQNVAPQEGRGVVVRDARAAGECAALIAVETQLFRTLRGRWPADLAEWTNFAKEHEFPFDKWNVNSLQVFERADGGADISFAGKSATGQSISGKAVVSPN